MPDGETTGLVLSGGGARGFAHIGVLKAAELMGFRADVVAGTSMGAIVGALHAAGKTADEILAIARGVTWRDIIDLSPLGGGLLKGDRLAAFLSLHLPKTFEELQKPLAVTTTDIESGQQVIHTRGDLIGAVRASSCFPGAFEPVELDGRILMDGGIVNNLPVEAAAALGSTWMLASNTTEPRRITLDGASEGSAWWRRVVATVRLERRTELVQVLLRSTDIMQAILTDMQYALHPADILVRMDLPGIRLESFGELERAVSAGQLAGHAAIEAYLAGTGR